MRPHIDKSSERALPGADAVTADAATRRGAADGECQAEPGVHLGPLAGMIGFALRRAQLAVFDEAIGSLAELDLRPAQISVLTLIGHRPGLKQSEVAAVLRIQRANVVALLDGLEQRGLALRKPAAYDRRCHALHLTAEGERVLVLARPLIAAIEARIDTKLGPGGREQLLDLLWRVARD